MLENLMNKKIDDINVVTIINLLHTNGYEAYLSGDSVRDLVMGLKPSLYDIQTNARPNQIKEVFSNFKTLIRDEKYGTICVIIDKLIYHVTTFISGKKPSDDNDEYHVIFCDSIYDVLSKKDFTINAIAVDINQDGYITNIIDRYYGYGDIAIKMISTVNDPINDFKEDYVRILKAVRFAYQYSFTICSNVYRAIKLLLQNDHQCNISKEDIQYELNKILLHFKFDDYKSPRKDCFIDILKFIYPNFGIMVNYEQDNIYHNLKLLDHTLVAISNAPKQLDIRLALLFHDVGKLTTRAMISGVAHYYNHGDHSFNITKNIMTELNYSDNMIDKVSNLVLYHDRRLVENKSSIKKLASKISYDTIRDLIYVKLADISAQNPKFYSERKEHLDRIKLLVDVSENEDNCITIKDLEINGNILMNELNINGGPEIGRLLKLALDYVIENPENNRKDILLKYIKERM